MDRTLDLWDEKTIEFSELSKLFYWGGDLEDANTEGVLMMKTQFMKFQREENTLSGSFM